MVLRVINWDNQCCKFTDVSDLRSRLLSDFKNLIYEDTFQFGYIQPSHGAKGQQVLVDNNAALDQMYCAHKKNLLILWLKVTKRATKRVATIVQQKGTKKPCADTTNTSGSNYQGHLKNMSEVQEIVHELEKKHEDSYTPEQLRAWRHMIQLRKHDSYEVPPSKPFFKTKKAATTPPSVTLSPGKRISYRKECINQLDKWHSLLEKGVISKTQFDEIQGTILNDIKNF